jgi:hypothetical protein
MAETIWGYWLDHEGGTFIELPKLPLTRAGFTQPPFTVTRPDGKVLLVVERIQALENITKKN